MDASDPAVAGTLADSPEVDGIDHVDFELFGPDGQHLYHHLERWAPYCGFDDGDPCNIYNFADHDYKWPKGQPIANGPLRMVATIYARDGRVKTIDTTVTIQGIPEQHAPENSAGDQVQHDYGSGVQVPLGYFMEEKHD